MTRRAGAQVEWEHEAELALRAVSSTADAVLGRTDAPLRLATTTKESRRDVVTAVDLEIEARIRTVLAGSGHPIVGEETFADDPASALAALGGDGACWLVDPIDGTANFVTGMPWYAVSIGLRVQAAFVTGAVAIPPLKELYFTHGTRGAFLNGRRLRVTDRPLAEALVAASFGGSSRDGEYRDRQYRFFGEINDASRGCLRLGSAAANLCFTAAGRLQAAYGAEARVWDVAGGLAVASQAGCEVQTWPGRDASRIDYVAGAPSTVREIVERMRARNLLSGLE